MPSMHRDQRHSRTEEQARDWQLAPERGRHEQQVRVRPGQRRTGRRRRQPAANEPNYRLLYSLYVYFCISSLTYKLEHFDWEFDLFWFDVIETIALCVLMLVDQKRRLFILASDAHDLFMMTNRIDNAYYAVCGFMVFLDAFPNISQYFLIVFSSNKVLRGILMTSYRPA